MIAIGPIGLPEVHDHHEGGLGRVEEGEMGYSHFSNTEAPIIPTNSKAPEIPTVFWLGSHLSDSKKGP